MITLRKLRSLPPGTRVRKTSRLIESFERELRRGVPPDSAYLLGLLQILREDIASGKAVDVASRARTGDAEALGEAAGRVASAAEALSERLDGGAGQEELIRSLNALRHALLTLLAMEPGEWDLHTADTRSPEGPEAGSRVAGGARDTCFDIALYLEDIRSPFNLGSIARSAEAFGAAGLILSSGVPRTTHPRAQRAAMGSFELLPTARCDPRCDPRGAGALPLFALEVGGTPISEFVFPRRGVCLVGSEELGLSPEALEMADSSWGRCSIPLHGAKGSLNVSVAAGILLGRWSEALGASDDGRGGDGRDADGRGAYDSGWGAEGEKKDPAELRQGLFDVLVREFCHGLR